MENVSIQNRWSVYSSALQIISCKSLKRIWKPVYFLGHFKVTSKIFHHKFQLLLLQKKSFMAVKMWYCFLKWVQCGKKKNAITMCNLPLFIKIRKVRIFTFFKLVRPYFHWNSPTKFIPTECVLCLQIFYWSIYYNVWHIYVCM